MSQQLSAEKSVRAGEQTFESLPGYAHLIDYLYCLLASTVIVGQPLPGGAMYMAVLVTRLAARLTRPDQWRTLPKATRVSGYILSALSALIALALLLVSLGLIRDAVISLYGIAEGNAIPVPKGIALAVAIVSIAVKEQLYRVTLKTPHRAKSSALAANAAHHRSDALSSIPAALSVGTVLAFGQKWTFLDPVGTIVVAMFLPMIKIISSVSGGGAG